MSRAIVNVATGARYLNGQARMRKLFPEGLIRMYRDCLPTGSPRHQDVPYAMKAFGLNEAADAGAKTLLWMDASIMPGARPLEDLWKKIEQDGYWISKNGDWNNYQWTADSAYPDLFPVVNLDCTPDGMDAAREVNRTIQHVIAGAFGISLEHPTGRAILEEYLRLAKTKAFCGPWRNGPASSDGRTAPCGPPDVRGHRHDQSSLSVIAWRLGLELSDEPEWIAYRGHENESTCLVLDGNF